MASSRRIDFSRLNTPEHGAVLVEPPASALAGIARHNHELLSRCTREVFGVPLNELRRRVRRDFLAGDDRLMIVTGHQPDFIHTGVWAKHVVAVRLAEAVGGVAVNLIVDQDVPKSTHLDVPRVRKDGVVVESISYAPWWRGAFELIPAVDRDLREHFASAVRNCLGDRVGDTMMPIFLDAYTSAPVAGDWVDQAVAGRKAVERALGIDIRDERVSRVWGGPLLGEMIANARRFADAYNRSLEAYRREFGVIGSQRPVPDLRCDETQCELPVWVYRGDERRRRLFVRPANGSVELYAGGTPLGRLSGAATSDWNTMAGELAAMRPWRFRPRAMTLTLWARLVLGDLFIHGVGGARYDRATDELIREYFGIEPPGIACVSATLHPDLPTHPLQRDAVRIARRRVRDVEYNPQRYIDDERIEANVEERQRWIDRSRYLREREPDHHAERRRVFHEIRSANQRILDVHPEVRTHLRDELERARRWSVENVEARRRDYFFAILTRAELERLIEALPATHDLAD